jgi:3-hydroxyacyl-CoA dehydrogenase
MFRRVALNRFQHVAVWGGGTMGGGIAQVTASAGINVTVVEVNEDRCNAARKMIEQSLMRVAKKKFAEDDGKAKEAVASTLSLMTFTTDEKLAASRAELIIEAIVESMDAKVALWKKVDEFASKDCVFATNTSSLSVAEQAKVTTRPDRFGGLHFFSPVPMMKLVEVVQADSTSKETTDKLYEFSQKIGKTAVVAKDTKGFIVNRLLIPYMLESCRLVERGVATVEDVDIAMKLGAGHPMGPFTLSDSVGIDVLKLIADAWSKAEPENPIFKPSKLIDEKVAAGKLGRKTGEGFYKYTK